MSDADQGELDQRSAEYDSRADMMEEIETSEDDQKRLAQIEDRIDELKEKRRAYHIETLETAGAIVTLNHQGGIRIERGYVFPNYARWDANRNATTIKDAFSSFA